MKKLLLILILVAVSALMFNFSALADKDGSGPAIGHGPAPNSGDGIPDGSGMDGRNRASKGHGPAPNSGDGVHDGSGMDGHYGNDGDDGTLMANDYEFTIDIFVSPQTITLHSRANAVFTVHASIKFNEIVPGSLYVEIDEKQIMAARIRPDNNGDLVAKFILYEFIEICKLGENEVTLGGTTIQNESFAGVGFVRVIY